MSQAPCVDMHIDRMNYMFCLEHSTIKAVSHTDVQPGEHGTDAAVPAIISNPECRDR